MSSTGQEWDYPKPLGRRTVEWWPQLGNTKPDLEPCWKSHHQFLSSFIEFILRKFERNKSKQQPLVYRNKFILLESWPSSVVRSCQKIGDRSPKKKQMFKCENCIFESRGPISGVWLEWVPDSSILIEDCGSTIWLLPSHPYYNTNMHQKLVTAKFRIF